MFPKKEKPPHLFSRINTPDGDYLFIPQLSSESREYLPVGFVDAKSVPLGPHFFIDGATTFEFAILSSRIHATWMRSVSGKFKMDYRYASTLVYNTFPLPRISDKQREEIENSARDILFARENHTEKTLAEMYEPDKMPEDLKEAHEHNDLVVDRLYRLKPYENDEERLADLFELYEKMTADEEK